MSTLRQRPRPTRALSTSEILPDSPVSPILDSLPVPPPSLPSSRASSFLHSSHDGPRRRSHSLHSSSTSSLPFPSRLAALEYGSSLLESLDLPASLGGVKEYLLTKMDEAERGLRKLKEMLDEESEAEMAETEDEDESRGGRSRESSPGSSRAVSPSRASGDPADAEFATLEDDLSTLEAFISSATSFLAALRDELPSLSTSLPSSSSSSSPLLAFHLSPSARAALDAFLVSHPLPSLPHYGVRASAHSLLARVTGEMETLRATMTYLTSPSSPSTPSHFDNMASYFPTIPSAPAINLDLASLRSQFSAESARFTTALSHLKEETKEGLSSLSGKAHDAIDEAKRMYHAALEAGQTRLLKFEELPLEWRNNEHLLDGYRFLPIERWPQLLLSAFSWHNETVNIQSHFLGFLSLSLLLVYHLFLSSSSPHSLANADAGDTAITVLFVLSAMHCLACSSAWHLLAGCASSRWFQGAACVDYVGISGLIAASVMGAEYYGFRSHPHLSTSYMVFSALVGLAGMIVPWSSWFNKREYKAYRIAFFVTLAGSAIAPIAHRSVLEGAENTFWFYSPAIPSVLAYVVGLCFYANHFPECCSPGTWNLGASHQFWHISIVAAIYLHWRAMNIWSTTVALAEFAGISPETALGAH